MHGPYSDHILHALSTTTIVPKILQKVSFSPVWVHLTSLLALEGVRRSIEDYVSPVGTPKIRTPLTGTVSIAFAVDNYINTGDRAYRRTHNASNTMHHSGYVNVIPPSSSRNGNPIPSTPGRPICRRITGTRPDKITHWSFLIPEWVRALFRGRHPRGKNLGACNLLLKCTIRKDKDTLFA